MIKRLKNLFKQRRKTTINILVRTSRRPNYFNTCYNSIVNQTFKNIKILVSYDNEETLEYLKKYDRIKKINLTQASPDNYPEPEIPRGNKIAKFPFNFYLNQLMKQVNGGFVIFLDDDDVFTSLESLEIIANHISSDNDLLFWRVQFPDGKLIPEDEYFSRPPQFWHVSGIGFAFHSKYIPYAQWDGWKGGDYAVASKLYRVVPNKIYVNLVLTGLQRQDGWGGFGKPKDKKVNE